MILIYHHVVPGAVHSRADCLAPRATACGAGPSRTRAGTSDACPCDPRAVTWYPVLYTLEPTAWPRGPQHMVQGPQTHAPVTLVHRHVVPEPTAWPRGPQHVVQGPLEHVQGPQTHAPMILIYHHVVPGAVHSRADCLAPRATAYGAGPSRTRAGTSDACPCDPRAVTWYPVLYTLQPTAWPCGPQLVVQGPLEHVQGPQTHAPVTLVHRHVVPGAVHSRADCLAPRATACGAGPSRTRAGTSDACPYDPRLPSRGTQCCSALSARPAPSPPGLTLKSSIRPSFLAFRLKVAATAYETRALDKALIIRSSEAYSEVVHKAEFLGIAPEGRRVCVRHAHIAVVIAEVQFSELHVHRVQLHVQEILR
ncbi:Uncharacterized protein OBRU01_09591 [Operophtera brumata]|uniref:Uncharacterized protein n=1 Tax=Operophtera brumata TaxID=104452 RepID=A0A0L7KWD3_OPEBR|nr:Uncharacterized protein OBRU01_09591 [Operophtera brumata]